MKYIAPAAAIALAATQVSAGSMIEPEMEPMVEVAQEEPASSSGWILPLLAIGLMVALVGSSSDSTEAPAPQPPAPPPG